MTNNDKVCIVFTQITVHQRNGALGCLPLGGSGLEFVIQDHTDHGAWKESFRRALREFKKVRYFKTFVCTWLARLIARAFSAKHIFSWLTQTMELKQKQVLITICILGNPECLRSVANRFNITKSILFRVYRRICGAIANNLSGQYMKYLLVWNSAPLGKMINFGSFAQRNALDQWSKDPTLDHADQWCDESLFRVDLIDHWSENGFARKERQRSEIQIGILPRNVP